MLWSSRIEDGPEGITVKVEAGTKVRAKEGLKIKANQEMIEIHKRERSSVIIPRLKGT